MTDGHIEQAEWRWVFISSGILILLTLLPYLWAYTAAVPDLRFMGLLANPADGASYLAKMQQGFRGDWFFHLPFTPEPHEPVFLFTFYLFLGHLSKWLALPMELIFHTTRVIGSLYMLLMIYIFAADWTDDVLQRRVTWGLTAVGSGLGWLLIAVGYITPDLNIPEAFPLYAAFSNAHFPWAIALIAFMAHTLSRTILDDERGFPSFDATTLGLIASTLFMLATMPFALAPLGAGVGIFLIWRWFRRRRFPRRELMWGLVVVISALPQILYGLWAVSAANPVFHIWNMQNVTPSPPPWDYALGFGLILVLAILAIWKSWRTLGDGEHDGDVLLLSWLVANALLLYAPIRLQRRLSIGLIIPLAIFAARALTRVILPTVRLRWRPLIVAGAFILIAPTTVLALVLPLQGTVTLDQRFYITLDEQAALDWLAANTAPDDVVLASPTFSLFIPGRAGARVVYGHLFETLHAEQRYGAVLDYYADENCNLIAEEDVDFVVYGPREEALGGGCLPDTEPVYAAGSITIFQTDGD